MERNYLGIPHGSRYRLCDSQFGRKVGVSSSILFTQASDALLLSYRRVLAGTLNGIKLKHQFAKLINDDVMAIFLTQVSRILVLLAE